MKIILVGLDGTPGVDPLDPSKGSGARLAALAGLSPGAFLDRFDRIDLFPPGGGDRPWEAVLEILPVLRGRRVVALGRVVADALGVGPDWFRWRRCSRFVGCAMPHPSGLSHWWNDPSNVDTARVFMEGLLRPCVHVEGPDGSGKSTLVDSIVAATGLRKIPTDDPPSSWEECLSRVGKRLDPGIVCDRSSGLISELVYGPVLRGSTIVDEEEIWWVVRSIVHAVKFVYCRPPEFALSLEFRTGESPSHVSQVKSNLGRLSRRYDEVFERLYREGAQVIRYDRMSGQTPSEVIRCVE